MGYNLNYRRWAAIMIILFCAAIAAGSFYWAAWVSVASFFVTLLIVDFLFLDKEDFLYDPDFKVRSVVCVCVCVCVARLISRKDASRSRGDRGGVGGAHLRARGAARDDVWTCVLWCACVWEGSPFRSLRYLLRLGFSYARCVQDGPREGLCGFVGVGIVFGPVPLDPA